MPAQRQRVPAKVAAIRPQSRPRSAPPVVPESPELAQLHQARADALAWLFALERRIGTLERVVLRPDIDLPGED